MINPQNNGLTSLSGSLMMLKTTKIFHRLHGDPYVSLHAVLMKGWNITKLYSRSPFPEQNRYHRTHP